MCLITQILGSIQEREYKLLQPWTENVGYIPSHNDWQMSITTCGHMARLMNQYNFILQKMSSYDLMSIRSVNVYPFAATILESQQ